MTLTTRFATDAFRCLDVHHRGWLEVDRVGELVARLGLSNVSEQERVALIRSMDPGATGRVEFGEYEQAIARRLAPADSPEELAEFLRTVDSADAGLTAAGLVTAYADAGVKAREADAAAHIAAATDGAEEQQAISGEHWRYVLTTKTSATRRATKY
jgi:Ca2+-binding EF-hand superfamily protein